VGIRAASREYARWANRRQVVRRAWKEPCQSRHKRQSIVRKG
jgi:hypothetical protein